MVIGNLLQRRGANGQNGNTGGQQRQAPPFQLVTKPNVPFIGTIDFAEGQAGNPLQITQAKLLARLHIIVTVTYTSDTTGAPAAAEARAPQNLIEELQVRLAGSDDPISVSGYELRQNNLVRYPGYVSPDDFAFADGETWTLHFDVPITVSRSNLQGLVMMQSRSTTAEVVISWADLDDVVTIPDNTQSMTGQAQVWGEFFEIPSNPGSMPPLEWIHQIRTFPTPITSAGETEVHLPTGDIIQRLQFHVVDDGVLDDADGLGLQNIELDYSGSYTQFDMAPAVHNLRDAIDRRAALDTGVYTIDLATRPPRDYLDTKNVTDLHAELEFANGPTGDARIITVVEQLVRLT